VDPVPDPLLLKKSGSAGNLFSTSSMPALGPTQPTIERVSGAKGLGREADHSPPTSSLVKKNVDLYIRSPIRLHGIVL
jgi:hypothetical protein